MKSFDDVLLVGILIAVAYWMCKPNPGRSPAGPSSNVLGVPR